MGWKNWNADVTLLCYRGDWYRTSDDMHQGRSVLAVFDVVIEITGNEYNVIKDRYSGHSGKQHAFTDLLRMQLFASGRTFYDLPKFTKSHEISGPGNIGYKDNGDLFEYPESTRTI